MPSGIGAYDAAGPVSGNVPPIVIVFAVTPGVCVRAADRTGHRERERRDQATRTR